MASMPERTPTQLGDLADYVAVAPDNQPAGARMTAPTKTTWPCGICLHPITSAHAWVLQFNHHIHATCYSAYLDFMAALP